MIESWEILAPASGLVSDLRRLSTKGYPHVHQDPRRRPHRRFRCRRSDDQSERRPGQADCAQPGNLVDRPRFDELRWRRLLRKWADQYQPTHLEAAREPAASPLSVS